MTKYRNPRIPDVRAGGVAIPLGNNFFYMKGRKHSTGGIDIGDDLEVEDGEVMQLDNDGSGARVYSSVPFLRGSSPAQLVIGGANPNDVFRAQENFKDRNRIKDDGTKYNNGGVIQRNDSTINNRNNNDDNDWINSPNRIRRINAKNISPELRHVTKEYVDGRKAKMVQINSNVITNSNRFRNIADSLLDTRFVNDLYGAFYTAIKNKNPFELARYTRNRERNTNLIINDLVNDNTFNMYYDNNYYDRDWLEKSVDFINNVTNAKDKIIDIIKKNKKQFGGNMPSFSINGNIKDGLIFVPSSTGKLPSNNSKTCGGRTKKKCGGRKKADWGTVTDGKTVITPYGNILRTDTIPPVVIGLPGTPNWVARVDRPVNVGNSGAGVSIPYIQNNEKINDIGGTRKGEEERISERQRRNDEFINQYGITPQSLYRADRLDRMGYNLNQDNGGYDPFEELDLLARGIEGTPESFKWRTPAPDIEYMNPYFFNIGTSNAGYDSNTNLINGVDGLGIKRYKFINTGNRPVQPQPQTTVPEVPKATSSAPRRGNIQGRRPVTTRPVLPTYNPYKPDYGDKLMALEDLKGTALITPTPDSTLITTTNQNNNNEKDDGRYRGLYNAITPNDWWSLGANIAGSFGSWLAGLNSPRMRVTLPDRPILESPVRMRTSYNNRPEVSRISEETRRAMRDVRANTASSRAALQRLQRLHNARVQGINESEANKYNIETQLRNADAANRQGVRTRNVNAMNRYLTNRAETINRQNFADYQYRLDRVNRNIGLLNNVNVSFQDFLDRINRRENYNNTLGYLFASHPNVDDRAFRDALVRYAELVKVNG